MTAGDSDSGQIELRVGPWTVRVDREGTRSVYHVVEHGGARRCGCDLCVNFDWHRKKGRALTPLAIRLLAELGIDAGKEAETVHHGKDQDGHLYEWWYHAIGEVIGGPEPTEPILLDDRLSATVQEGRAVAHEEFQDRRLIEVSFLRPLPWALATSEPE